MQPNNSEFKQRVEAIVRLIPVGHVMTYGQIAELLGMPRAAQAVGWTAHWGNPEVPWQRVVNRHGRVAPGWPGGMPAHAAALAAEGVKADGEGNVDLTKHQWWPDDATVAKLELSLISQEFLAAKLPYSS